MDFLNSVKGIEKQIVYKATMARQPISGGFELLPLCNLNCRMCFMRGAAAACGNLQNVLPKEFWIDVAKELASRGTLFLLLTGGEPYLYPEFEALYEALIGMGFIMTINTNGTMITKERAHFLGMHMPRRVNVTLYGASRETYRKVTGSASAYDKTIDGIKYLLEEHVPVKINISLIPENVDKLEDFYRIGAELGVPLEVNSYMFPATREAGEVYDETIRISPERAAEAELLSFRLEHGEEAYAQYVNRLAAAYDTISIEETELQKDEKGVEPLPCRAARSSFWVDWRGQMSPCVFLTEYRVSLLQESFGEAWNQVGKMIDTLHLPSKCSKCKMREFCQVCGAGVYHENHDMDQAPEYLCRLTREKLKLAKVAAQEFEK